MDQPVFQTAQNANFDNSLILYGQCCTWLKDGGSITDKVLFNDPTQNQRFNVVSGRGLNHVGYDNADILRPYIEFRCGQFKGLFDLVYGDAPNQFVTLTDSESGITIKYVCVQIKAFFDGKTFRIGLQKAKTTPTLPGI